jgi:hypothetical protein
MIIKGRLDSRSEERVKHIVMWNALGSSEQEKEAAFAVVKSRFESLRGLIPGMTHLEIGVDFSRACDIVLYTEFESKEALAAYATHRAHLKVRDELDGVRVARYQVDYVSE